VLVCYDTGAGTCLANEAGFNQSKALMSLPTRNLGVDDGGYSLILPEFFVKDMPLQITLK